MITLFFRISVLGSSPETSETDKNANLFNNFFLERNAWCKVGDSTLRNRMETLHKFYQFTRTHAESLYVSSLKINKLIGV